MSRIARVVIPQIPHHVTQRGNGRQTVFHSDTDRRVYWRLYKQYAQRFGLRTWGYCLMDNHVHFVVVPEREDSLSRALGRTHAEYARYWNASRASCGHVWQARYFSCPLDDAYVWQALRYVERNPVRAGLVQVAGDWPWSSAGAHLAGRDREGFLDLSAWWANYDSPRWRSTLVASVAEEALQERLREATICGRPLGSAEFVAHLERVLERPLNPRRAGRPPKNSGSAMAAEIGN